MPGLTAHIFLNGDFRPPPGWPAPLAPGDLVLAADGGGRHVAALGWPLHFLVGDLDSLEPELAEKFRASGTEIRRYPRDKNETDFELALDLARQKKPARIEVLAALGGRWDMSLANLLAPLNASPSEELVFRHGDENFYPLTGPARLNLRGRPGDRLSLLPLGGDALELRLAGVKYPLNNETLVFAFGRGLSNEFISAEASLAFQAGRLLVIHQPAGQEPGAAGPS